MDIVCNLDGNYVMPIGIMMKSLCLTNKDVKKRFHLIVDDTVGDKEKTSLIDNVSCDNAEVFFYKVDQKLVALLPSLDKGLTHLSISTYYRIFMSEILPSDIDKVLFLDGDIIIRSSLKELWDTDVTGYPLAACTDMDEGEITRYNRLGYSSSLGYFNAGVLLINLKYWRENNVLTQFLEFINKTPERIKFCDQDVLNYFFCHNKLNLPLKFNCQSGILLNFEFINIDFFKYRDEIIEARHNPVIVHYTLEKPWNINCGNPLKDLFIKTKSLTIWKDRELQIKSYISFKEIMRKILVSLGVLHRVPIAENKYSDYPELKYKNGKKLQIS